MLQRIDGFDDNVVAVRAVGTVTADDYQSVLEPALEAAAAGGRKIRVLFELGEEFTGYDAGAMVEDTKAGLGSRGSFERIAVVSDVGWVRHAFGMFGGLMHGEVRVFANADEAEARAWIAD